MSFTRKFLSAMGIEPDKVDEIMSAHIEVVDGLKGERDTYKANAEKLADVEKKLNEANDKIAKYGDEETIAKSEYDKINDELTKLKAKEVTQAKEHALRELYKAAGISEKRLDAVMKVSKLDDVELDDDGKIKDADKLTESAKTEWSDFIENDFNDGANIAKPPKSNPSEKDPFEIGFDEG